MRERFHLFTGQVSIIVFVCDFKQDSETLLVFFDLPESDQEADDRALELGTLLEVPEVVTDCLEFSFRYLHRADALEPSVIE